MEKIVKEHQRAYAKTLKQVRWCERTMEKFHKENDFTNVMVFREMADGIIEGASTFAIYTHTYYQWFFFRLMDEVSNLYDKLSKEYFGI